MKRSASLVELLAAVGLVLLLGSAMFLAVREQRRRSRDAERVSSVRQLQAALGLFQVRHASYPGSVDQLSPGDAAAAKSLGYQPDPPGCDASALQVCRSYRLTFSLEGPVGTLDGTRCVADPQGLSCSL